MVSTPMEIHSATPLIGAMMSTDVTDGGVAFHDFPVDVYTSYTVLVTIRDGRGGEVVHRFDIDFPAPPATRHLYLRSQSSSRNLTLRL